MGVTVAQQCHLAPLGVMQAVLGQEAQEMLPPVATTALQTAAGVLPALLAVLLPTPPAIQRRAVLHLLRRAAVVWPAWRTRPLRAVHRSRLGSAPWRSLSTECSADVLVRRVPSGSAMALHEYLLLARHFPVASVGARQPLCSRMATFTDRGTVQKLSNSA